MANVTTSDWSIAYLPTGQAGNHNEHVVIQGRKKHARVRFTLSATQALAYPSSGGIPLPTWKATTNSADTSWGMVRNLDYIKMVQQPGGGGVWRWVASDHAIRGYRWGGFASAIAGPSAGATAASLAELPTDVLVSTINAAGLAFVFEMEGW